MTHRWTNFLYILIYKPMVHSGILYRTQLSMLWYKCGYMMAQQNVSENNLLGFQSIIGTENTNIISMARNFGVAVVKYLVWAYETDKCMNAAEN